MSSKKIEVGMLVELRSGAARLTGRVTEVRQRPTAVQVVVDVGGIEHVRNIHFVRVVEAPATAIPDGA